MVDPLRLAFGNRPFIENYRWEPERGTRIWVIDRGDGGVQGPFETDAGLRVPPRQRLRARRRDRRRPVRLRRPGDRARALPRPPARGRPARSRCRGCERWRIDTAARRVRRERLADEAARAAADRLRGAATAGRTGSRTARARSPTPRSSTAWSRSTSSDGSAAVWHEDGTLPGRAGLRPAARTARPRTTASLLSVVLDAERERSFLLVLDAATFAERARAEVPHHIPFGFHGQYFGSLH